MRHFHTIAVTLLPALAISVSVSAQTPGLCLHYDRPAEFFEEALVIGNGTMGATIYGGTGTDRLSLNDITLWTGEPVTGPSEDLSGAVKEIRDALDREDYALADKLQCKLQGPFSQNYQPLGNLLITYRDTLGKVDSYRRWLDIGEATAHTRFKRGVWHYETEYFASNPDRGLVLRITTDNPKGVDADIALDCPLPHETTKTQDGLVLDGYTAYASLPNYYDAEDKFLYDPDRGIHFRIVVKTVKEGGSLTVFVVSATSFNGFDKDPAKEGRDYKGMAVKKMKNIASLSYDRLRERHIRDYKSIFDRVSLSLDPKKKYDGSLSTDRQLLAYLDESQFNPALETLYFQYGRYLLISCSRTKAVPANLQGLWNEYLLPPWSSNYTTNINLEENYWGAETANLPEMHLSLLSFLKSLQGSGERTAKSYYGVNKGWCLAHNSDIWAMTNPVGLNTGDPSWADWNMGGAWVSTHIWEHYAFSLDKDFLREYYPVLKGAAEFCLGWMIEKNGFLMTSPATSPENRYVTDKGYQGQSVYGGAADLAMIRECLTDAKYAALELSCDAQFVSEIDKALSKLQPYKIGKKGNLQEWYHDWEDQDPQHRHQSHLFGLYPGRNLKDGQHSEEELRRAAERTLEIKGDRTTGWSTGWRINLYARLGDARNAYHSYRMLLKYVSPDNYQGPDKLEGGGTYPNLLDAHSPFQIDGNFGGCAGVVEMLLQSDYTGKTSLPSMSLLPALPENWKDGSVKGIRARGGYTIEMGWEDSKVVSLKITALKKGRVMLKVNGKSREIQLRKGANRII